MRVPKRPASNIAPFVPLQASPSHRVVDAETDFLLLATMFLSTIFPLYGRALFPAGPRTGNCKSVGNFSDSVTRR